MSCNSDFLREGLAAIQAASLSPDNRDATFRVLFQTFADRFGCEELPPDELSVWLSSVPDPPIAMCSLGSNLKGGSPSVCGGDAHTSEPAALLPQSAQPMVQITPVDPSVRNTSCSWETASEASDGIDAACLCFMDFISLHCKDSHD